MSLDDLNRNDQENIPVENSSEDTFSAFEQVNQQEPKKPKKKLSKRMLTVLLTSGLALVLAGALVLLLLFPTTEPEPDDNTPDTPETATITLLDKSEKGKTVIQQVDVKNADDTYTIYYNDEQDAFVLKGYEDILLSSSITDSLVTYTASLVALAEVNDPGNLKEYGLDKPDTSVTITYKDGSSAHLSVGALTPSEDGYYVTTDAKDGVYIFSTESVALFAFRAVAYADTTLITTPTVKKDDANGSALLKEVTYSGSQYPTPLKLRRSYHTDSEEITLFTYIIEKPYLRGTSDSVMGQLSNFKSLSASQALVLHPTDAQKEQLGFNDPLSVIRITMAVETSEDLTEGEEVSINTYYNETTTTVTIGSIDAGNYLVMMDGVDAIFLVDQSAFSAVAERTYINTVSQLLFLKNITSISRISIKTDGVRNDFVLQHYPDREEDDRQMRVTVEGKKYPTGDFRELYQLLMGLERYGESDRKPSGDPVMEVDMYTIDGEHYLGAKYYPLSGSLCAVVTTEGEVFTTRWHNVNHFTQQVENYLNGEKVLILT